MITYAKAGPEAVSSALNHFSGILRDPLAFRAANFGKLTPYSRILERLYGALLLSSSLNVARLEQYLL